jgi:hypothetical protein
MKLMGILTAYLYGGSLVTEIQMKVPLGIKVPNKDYCNLYSVKL